MRLFDTHCHLDAQGNMDGPAALIEAALKVGVEHIVLPAVEPDNWSSCIEIARAHPKRVSLALGIHPQAVRDLSDAAIDEALAALPALLKQHGAVAVGETGLDFRWDKDEPTRQRQRRALQAQLEIAKQLGLPPILHCLDAYDPLMQQWRALKPDGLMGVMHSYSGSAELVTQLERLGMWISYSGSVTWSNAKRVPRAAQATSAARLLIETDAPYQPPHPLDEHPNRPARLPEVAQRLAQLRETTPEEIAALSWDNATRAFGLLT